LLFRRGLLIPDQEFLTEVIAFNCISESIAETFQKSKGISQYIYEKILARHPKINHTLVQEFVNKNNRNNKN